MEQISEKTRHRSNRIAFTAILVVVLACGAYYLYGQYQMAFEPYKGFDIYQIPPRPTDDTLRVAVIGDSWAEYHTALECDTIFLKYAKRITQQPIKCFSRGHSGMRTKEVYKDMFSAHTIEHAWSKDFCTQPLLEQHPDYCVVMAGINDLCWQKPVSYYLGNYRNILQVILQNGIRPVVMGIPEIDVSSPISNRVWYQQMYLRMVSWWSKAGWYDVSIYQQAMRQMLQEEGLTDKVLFIPAEKWNPGGVDKHPEIYLDDRYHLNLDGYQILDSCMAVEIIKDYERRNNRQK